VITPWVRLLHSMRRGEARATSQPIPEWPARSLARSLRVRLLLLLIRYDLERGDVIGFVIVEGAQHE